MQETFARAGLIDAARLRQLSQKSDLRGYWRMAEHFGAIAITGCLLYFSVGTPLLVVVFVIHGVLLNFLYAAEHELSHSTVFHTRKANEVFGRLIGFLVLAPRDADQIQHFAHHRYTQHWRQDGELFRHHFTLASYLLRLSAIEYWYRAVEWLVVCSLGRVDAPYMTEIDQGKVIAEARWHMAGYGLIAAISVYFWNFAAILYWLGPMLLTKSVHQLQNTIEHVGMPKVADILLNTRTIRTNRVMRWMCWNMQYHTAHHAFPGVPFFRLPDLHHEIFVKRGVVPTTMNYLDFQLKVIRALAQKGEIDYALDQPWTGLTDD